MQKVKDGFWRSRRVLTPEEAALLGKKALTKATGTTDYDEAKRICEGQLAEFERIIADARGDHLSPLDKLLRDNPHLRFARSMKSPMQVWRWVSTTCLSRRPIPR